MASDQFRSIHIRAVSGWRALALGGLVLVLFAALAFLAFGLFLVLLPVAAVVGLASLFFPRRRPASFDGGTGGVIETDYRVISEQKMRDDEHDGAQP